MRARFVGAALAVALLLGLLSLAQGGTTQKNNTTQTQTQTQQTVTTVDQHGDQNSLAEKQDTQQHDTKSLKQAISSGKDDAKVNQKNITPSRNSKFPKLREDFRRKVAQTTLPSKTIERAFEKVPGSFGLGSVNKKGDGWKWTNQKGKNIIRIDMPNPNARFQHQRVMHVIIRSKDEYIDKNGQPTLSSSTPEAHIPYDEWITWRYWNKP